MSDDDPPRPPDEGGPVAMARGDASGAAPRLNGAWLHLHGLQAGEPAGTANWLARLHEDDHARVSAFWQSATGDALDLRYRVIPSAGGSPRWLRCRRWAVAREGAPDGAWLAVAEDITHDVERERQLQQTLELLDRTGRLSGVGGWQIDLETGHVTWTEQTCRLHEVPVGHVPTVEEGIHYWAPEAQDEVRRVVERMVAEGGTCDFELPMVTAKGRRIWSRVVGETEQRDGRTVRLFGASQDTTARRAAADELQASRERLKRLYDETPALLASMDAAGAVLSISNLLLERLGLAREAVVGRPAGALLHGDTAERQATEQALRAQFAGRQGVRGVPVVLARRDGHPVHTLLAAEFERDGQGRVVRLLAVFDDISEELKQQAELARERALREEVQRQARALASLADERREMLDVLAHEVRQPLNNASAALQSASALAYTQRDPDALQRLSRAQGVIGDVVGQLDNTLAAAALLAGSAPLARTDTDIDTLVALSIADLPLADRSRVQTERLTPTRTASMDLSLMRLALRNLLVNALRHAPPGAPVTLRLADSDEPLALLIEVQDGGSGVAPELRSRLFERGARGPGSRGKGLGLYITKRALQLHGGDAELVESRRGHTVFRLTLVQGQPDGSDSPDGAPYSTSGALNT